MLVDSHAHLDHVDDLENVLARAKEAGVSKLITIGTSVESSKRCIELAEKYSSKNLQVYATVGLHPKDAKEEIEQFGLFSCFKTGKQLAQSSKKVVAIGECGLDYYVTSDMKHVTIDKDKVFQRELFEAQINLAAELDLPLVVHCRNGWSEIFDLLSNVKGQLSNVPGVFHSWTGDWKAAKCALDLGFYISFSGIVTFTNTTDIQEVAKKVPIDRILVETDSPFLSPEPHRGQQNEPKNVKIVAQFIADLRGISFAEISANTSDNAQRLFNIANF